MPIYAYRCFYCGNEQEELRKLADRMENGVCEKCDRATHFLMSFSKKEGPSYPFTDQYMDSKPVEITSLSQYRKELKKRGKQETGVGKGNKGQWI